jgi:hypothetical protein
MNERPIYLLTLRPLPGVDGIRDATCGLKVLFHRKVRGRYLPVFHFFVSLFNHLPPNLPDPAKRETECEHRQHSHQFKHKRHHVEFSLSRLGDPVPRSASGNNS